LSNPHHNFNEFNRKQKAKQLGLSEETSWIGMSEHLAHQFTNKPQQSNTSITDRATRVAEYGNLAPIAA